mgnify:CR=1 FL=1
MMSDQSQFSDTYSMLLAPEWTMIDEQLNFERYRTGYQDGYEGHDPEITMDAGYLQGYAAGVEDDLLGKDSRFPEDE